MRPDQYMLGRSCALVMAILLVFFAAGSLRAADRLTLNFNPAWKFIKADPAGAERTEFDDHNWTTVSTPHTYNDIDSFSELSPGNMRGETNLWSGRTWYRKTFTLPISMQGKRVYIEFEAVRQVADVYLNGHHLGICKNGFVPFGFDLTPYIQFGQPNVLAVMCDNRFMISDIVEQSEQDKSKKHGKETSAGTGAAKTLAEYSKRVNASIPQDVDQIQANQIPWNNPQWHPPLGGIYRDVRLYITDPLHITLPLYDFLQTVGPYVYATEISAKSANITVAVPVQNGRDMSENVTVQADVFDRDNKLVATWSQPETIGPGAKITAQLSGLIPNPNLWEPDYPYLYHVICSVRIGDKTIDSCQLPLGIHAVHWDMHTGFWINGHHLKLHGWGQRPTDEWPGLGTAQPDWLHFYTLDLMKKAGGNFVRWGHSAGGADMIRAGDELGFVTDQPGVDGESDTVGAAWKIRTVAFRDAIIYFRNNPSILLWEGGNQKVTQAHAAELRGIKDMYDPHGGRAFAFRRADQTTGKFINVSIGTEGSHEVPRVPVVEGEYDREESPRRVWDDYSPPSFGYSQAKGQTYDLTSEQFAVNEVDQFMRKIGAASACGGGNWIFSDSTSGGRNTTEVSRASGEVDGVRLPKEAYYVCQTIFRSDPQVHIIGHWNYPAGTKKTMYVTSNCPDVELFLNGKLLGHGKRSEEYLFTFSDVVWTAGELKAIAYENNSPVASDALHTAGPAVALRLSCITGPQGLQASCSDVALIDVEAIDANGGRCPTFEQRVDFTCAGPAIWRGGYNSGIPHSINNKYLNLECGINRVAVRSTLQPGAITITAACAGLKPASITIASHAFEMANGYSTSMPETPPVLLTAAHPDWTRLRGNMPPMTVTDASVDSSVPVGRYTRSFAYTGPTPLVHVETNASNGRNIYCDRDVAFVDLPAQLAGADWVQAADKDASYSAADLMQIEMKEGATVYVAHDSQIKIPRWLSDQFRLTDLHFIIKGRVMNVYAGQAANDESLTLGSNTVSSQAGGNMYVVFVKGR